MVRDSVLSIGIVWDNILVQDQYSMPRTGQYGTVQQTIARIYSRSLSVVCGTATTNARITEIVASYDPSSRKASICMRILSTI